MAVNGGSKGAIQELSRPTGSSGSAYVLPSLSGEIIYIPCSVSAMRLLVTGKETNNAFAVVGTGGTAAAPIGFHFHRETHDVFLCLKGNVNVWAGEKARTMGPGDFASVPPVSQFTVISRNSIPPENAKTDGHPTRRTRFINTRSLATTQSSSVSSSQEDGKNSSASSAIHTTGHYFH